MILEDLKDASKLIEAMRGLDHEKTREDARWYLWSWLVDNGYEPDEATWIVREQPVSYYGLYFFNDGRKAHCVSFQ